ncbi:hypothetical protein AB0B45_42560 [Nonomuraea sp. NPDC049152]
MTPTLLIRVGVIHAGKSRAGLTAIRPSRRLACCFEPFELLKQ